MCAHTCLKYFSQLLDEIECVECIKINLNASTNIKRHFDLNCTKCETIKNEEIKNKRLKFEKEQMKDCGTKCIKGDE